MYVNNIWSKLVVYSYILVEVLIRFLDHKITYHQSERITTIET